jgi:hypothetical protein
MRYGWDYETWLISDDMPIPKPVCLSFASETGDTGLLVGDDIEPFIKARLSRNDLLVAQNATFELLVTYHYYPKLRDLIWRHLDNGNFYCTQLQQQLLDNLSEKELHDKSLSGLVLHYFNKDISESKTDPDAWRLRYKELDGVPLTDWPDVAKEYAINDSIYALEVYKKQIKINGSIKYKSHLQASFALNLMAARGLLTDQNRVDILDKEIDAILKPTYDMLSSKGFMKPIKSGKNKGKLSKNIKTLQEHVKSTFTQYKYTDKKAIQVAGDALDFYLLEKDDKVVRAFREIGKYEKTKSAFISRLKTANPENPLIRTGYNAIVRSGRTSSRASFAYPSVNIQQQPRGLKGVTWDIRNCYIPRKGFKLVCIDYNNLELISCANQLYKHYGKSAMLDIINSGTIPTDLHSVFACELMSSDLGRIITYDEFMAHKKEDEYKQYRNKGKPVTLGVPGGMGYDTIRTQFDREGIKLPFEVLQRCEYDVVARRLKRKYEGEFPNIRVKRTGRKEWSLVFDEIVKLKRVLFKLYPDLEAFLSSGHKDFLNGEMGYAKNDFGEWEEEPYYKYNALGVKRDYCTYTAFCNGFLMQAPSAVGAKRTGYNLVREYEKNDDVFPLAFIHDEYIFEIRENADLHKNIDRCSEIMVKSMQEELPHGRVAVEAEWMSYWSKSNNEGSKVYWVDVGSDILKCS